MVRVLQKLNLQREHVVVVGVQVKKLKQKRRKKQLQKRQHRLLKKKKQLNRQKRKKQNLKSNHEDFKNTKARSFFDFAFFYALKIRSCTKRFSMQFSDTRPVID